VVAREVKEEAYAGIVDIEDIQNDVVGVDIGPRTIKLFENELSNAKTIVWNGPLGVFEIERFAMVPMKLQNSLVPCWGLLRLQAVEKLLKHLENLTCRKKLHISLRVVVLSLNS